jgi:tripartite-type tricarboxylate transporter receptor subunit TctC
MKLLFRPLAAVWCAAFALLALPTAMAQSYPSKPLHIVVPQAPGGGLDNVVRVIAVALGESIGQSVVIDNRVGAGGSIGVSAAAKSAPDGYTIVIGSSTTMAANNFLYKNATVDPIKDFVPLAMLGTIDFALVVPGNSPIHTLPELIAAAKARPGKLSYGFGTSAALLCGEMFKMTAQADITKIAYKGSPQGLTDLVAGRLDLVCEPVATSLPFIHEGRLRALAVTNSVRNELDKKIPTMAEAGLPFEFGTWSAFFAPAGTPPAIADRIASELIKVMNRPEVQEKIRVAGFIPKVLGAREVAAIHRADFARLEKVVKEAGITPE